MSNLLQETLSAIRNSGHAVEDVVFVGSKDGEYECSWDEFSSMADREYDGGFGAAEVATDLIVVFSDGQKLWRGEYDGSEWWNYSTPFVRKENSMKITRLYWRLLAQRERTELQQRG